MTTAWRARPLTEAQARTCEEAQGSVCKCRCGGAFHGMARGTAATGAAAPDVPREFFEGLEDNDPHHIPSVDEQKRRTAERRHAAYLRRKQARQPLLPVFAELVDGLKGGAK